MTQWGQDPNQGYQQPGYQQQPYQSAGYQQSFAAPQAGPIGGALDPAERSKMQTNAIILIIAGVLCGAMIPAIFGIIAMTQLDTNPPSARTMLKVGWIIFVVLFVVMAGIFILQFGVGFVLVIIQLLAYGSLSSS